MKPKRTADLSLFLSATVLLLASACFGQTHRALRPHDSTDHEFLPISQNPSFILPMEDTVVDSNLDYGTQAALNGLAWEYDKKMDSVLNFVYRSILHQYSVVPQFIKYFKRAEAAWIKYRDAELLAIRPPLLPGELHGSMEPICWSQYRSALTRQRIGELLMWLQVDETDQTGCDTFYPESFLQSMRSDRKHHEKK